MYRTGPVVKSAQGALGSDLAQPAELRYISWGALDSAGRRGALVQHRDRDRATVHIEEAVTPANTGTCALCKQQASKSQMARHVAGCAARHDAAGSPTPVVQMRIDGEVNPRYWLFVEARGEATLRQLDALLRRVWLECCGHMSAFRMGRQEAAMRSTIGVSLGRRGQPFTYDYDFGSTTTLRGRVLGSREGSLGRTAVRLLARNDPLRWRCEACTKPATVVCPICMDTGPSLFCAEHARQHPCAEEEVFLPVVNSPRMGVCAYGT